MRIETHFIQYSCLVVYRIKIVKIRIISYQNKNIAHRIRIVYIRIISYRYSFIKNHIL